MSDLISMDKQYKTRDGRAVEVLKVDINHHNFPVAIVVTNLDGSQCTGTRTSTGRMYVGKEHEADLIEVKPRVKQNVWLNVYPEKRPCVHLTRESADAYADDYIRLACVKIEIDCEHGEGL